MGGITMKFKNKRKIIFIMGIFILMASIILSVFVLMPPETNNKKTETQNPAIQNPTIQNVEPSKTPSTYGNLMKSFNENVPEVYYHYKDIDGNGVYELLILENCALYIYTYDDNGVRQIGSHDFVTGTFQFLESDNYNGIFVYTVGGGCDHYSYLTLCDDNISITKLCEYYYSADEPYWVDISDDKQMVAEAKKVYENVITFTQYVPLDFQGNSLSTNSDIGEMQPETTEIITMDGKCYQSYVASNVDIRYVFVSNEEYEMSAEWGWVPIGTRNFYSLDLLGKVNEGRK